MREFQISKKNTTLKSKNVYVDNPYFTIIPEEIFSNISDDPKNKILTKNQSQLNFFKSLHILITNLFFTGESKKFKSKNTN